VARRYELRVAETYPLFVGAERQLSWASCACILDVHPNDRGYTLIAQELLHVTYLPGGETSRLTGTVLDPAGTPLAGATVWYGGGVQRTDALGRFTFEDLAGNVPMRFVATLADGSAQADAVLSLTPGRDTDTTLVLAPLQTGGAQPYPTENSHSARGYARIAAAIGKALAHHARARVASPATAVRTGVTAAAGGSAGGTGRQLHDAWNLGRSLASAALKHLGG
jgi:hypothetical protein